MSYTHDRMHLIGKVVTQVLDEVDKAHSKYGKFASDHEVYGVLLEEVDEFWDDVKANQFNPYELIQIAGICIRRVVEEMEKKHEESLHRSS